MANDRADRGIVHRGIECSPRHQMLIGHAMAAVHRIPAAQDCIASQFLGHAWNHFRKLHSRDRSFDNTVFPFDIDWRLWLGIKGVVVAGPPLGPNQNAMDVRRIFPPLTLALGFRMGLVSQHLR